MEREISFSLRLARPGRSSVFALLFALCLCVPAVADDPPIGVTTVRTYYPIVYGSHVQPTVSERFELKSFIAGSSASCLAASLRIDGSSPGTLNGKGGTVLFAGQGIELSPSGPYARVNIATNAQLSGFLKWVPSGLVPTLNMTSPVDGIGGPYWTPICDGTLTADTRAAMCIRTSGMVGTHRLFIKAKIYFGRFESTGLRLYTNTAMTVPTGGTTP